MFSKEFDSALRAAIAKDLELNYSNYSNLSPAEQLNLKNETFMRLYNNKDISGNRLPYDPEKLSFWDAASQKFVKDAPGDFKLVVANNDPLSIANKTATKGVTTKGVSIALFTNLKIPNTNAPSPTH